MDIKNVVSIPNYQELKLKYLILDFNGTLASSGKVSDKTKRLLSKVAELLEVFVITADTFGNVEKELSDLPLKIVIISKDKGTKDKEELINKLGYHHCVAIGNGNNDELMLRKAQLSICLLGDEGCAKAALLASDIIMKDINDALMMILEPRKLIATLRK